MNTQIYNQADKPKKAEAVKQNKSDTAQYNLTKEEVAKDIIHALNDAQKFLRGEVKGRPIDELLDELDNFVEEERKNGRA